MTRQEKMIAKRIGRPPTGKGTLIGLRLHPPSLSALDAYAEDEAVTRPEAIRTILADWLRTHGYKIGGSTKPTGPATDVVEAMDAAIKAHKKARKTLKA